MIRECFWWYITLCRNRPFEATVIAGLVLFLIWAGISSAYLEVDPAENVQKSHRLRTDRHDN